MVVLDFDGALCRSVVVADLERQGRFDASRHLLDWPFYRHQPFRRDTDIHRYLQFTIRHSGHFNWLGFALRGCDGQRCEKAELTKCRLTDYCSQRRAAFRVCREVAGWLESSARRG